MAWVAVLLLGIPACAQSPTGSLVPPSSYLLRLVHAHNFENVCVLVRADGQYHFERDTAQKTEIFEGTLPLPDTQHIEHLLAAEELFDLTEDKIVKAPLSENEVHLVLSVHRPGHWQNLTFPQASSWESYHDSVLPLVHWLEEMRKAKNRIKLREEAARNNCLPPPKLELKVRH